ncbi:nucleotide exchange factor GrpE [Paucilactobacillus wasatchensis]|uniref:Protein GrpE n=1 Tax=Paucilactobacillus wasatchensis TaxID=1335616 RepID=A0A0D1A7K1_9LACO|nr:nucleotide exchange factor GrpE [Paucilactobacillus wasatchensis]KIS02701.1 Heat shock protein GrpE [Paucilactobacillus wasatchensis]
MAEKQTDESKNSPTSATKEAVKAEATADESKTAPKKETKKAEKKDSKKKVETLNQEIAKLKQQVDAGQDQYLRAEAEIQNMTTRFKKEQAQIMKYDGQSLAKGILPVMDNLKRALEIEVHDESGEQLKKGIQMVHDHLKEALTSNSVTEIDALGQKFDPTLHQAVQSVAVQGDQKPDTVVQVLQAGYQLKDRVLRPAMVVVAQ